MILYGIARQPGGALWVRSCGHALNALCGTMTVPYLVRSVLSLVRIGSVWCLFGPSVSSRGM